MDPSRRLRPPCCGTAAIMTRTFGLWMTITRIPPISLKCYAAVIARKNGAYSLAMAEYFSRTAASIDRRRIRRSDCPRPPRRDAASRCGPPSRPRGVAAALRETWRGGSRPTASRCSRSSSSRRHPKSDGRPSTAGRRSGGARRHRAARDPFERRRSARGRGQRLAGGDTRVLHGRPLHVQGRRLRSLRRRGRLLRHVAHPADWNGPGHNIEPLAVAANMCPTLAIFGSIDPWTPAADIDTLRAAWSGRSDCEIVMVEGGDHGFVHDPERDVHRADDAAACWANAISWILGTAANGGRPLSFGEGEDGPEPPAGQHCADAGR